MLNQTEFTVILPTNSGRAPMLPFSVASVLMQTVRNIELVVIGDGTGVEERAVLDEIRSKDERVKFFEFPKHERRGEPYRDFIIQEAAGRKVAYLCDRDLMFPDHLEILGRELEHVAFTHSLPLNASRSGQQRLIWELDLSREGDRTIFLRSTSTRHGFGLSFVAHTKQAYMKLAQRWSKTPDHLWTDMFMWQKFIRDAACTASTVWEQTIIYLPLQGRTPAQHAELLKRELDRLANPFEVSQLRSATRAAIIRNYLDLARKRRNTFWERCLFWKRYLIYNCPWRIFDHLRPPNVPAYRKKVPAYRKRDERTAKARSGTRPAQRSVLPPQ